MVHVPPPPPKEHRAAGRLTLLILSIASLLGSVAGLFAVAGGQEEDTLGPAQLPRRVLILALCGLFDVGFTTGVWGGRRWGVYGVLCVSLFAFMVNWKIGGPVIALPGLAPPALLGIAAAFTWADLD